MAFEIGNEANLPYLYINEIFNTSNFLKYLKENKQDDKIPHYKVVFQLFLTECPENS